MTGTAEEVRYRLECLFFTTKRPDLVRIDYDILTAGFDVVLPFARASLLWARVRSRWGSKRRCPACYGAGGWCNFCGEAKCNCPPEGGYSGWRSCDLCHPEEVHGH